jgi:hypothetical protein
MQKEEKLFKLIAQKFESDNENVHLGPMMSSPGIRYLNKVFAFYHDRKMVFKLGREFNPQTQGIKDFSILHPFKTKGPMKGWFEIPYSENKHWEQLAALALKYIKTEV